MPPLIAECVCWIGIAGLFYLDRDKNVHVSKALWLPVLWIGLVGSRPPSAWIGFTPAAGIDVQMEGNPVDRLIFQLLLAAGLLVLFHRRKRVKPLLKAGWPILLYFSFCLLSVCWSDFPDVSLKRWFKAISDLVMVLVIVTDADPVGAIKRVLSRVGFVLLPLSVLFIKYFDALGRAYTPDGEQMNTGVTTNKNMLGVITLVVSLGALWRLLEIWRAKEDPARRRHLLAQGVLLAFGLALLQLANSATSRACFVLGALLLITMRRPFFERRPRAVHALVLGVVLAGGLTMLLGGEAIIVHALGRQTDLTGRTDIWAAVLPSVPNKVVGAGFESFWLGPRVLAVYERLPRYMHVNEAHNGYIEVYLNLGWIGVGLIALILFFGYKQAVQAFRRNPPLGGLMLVYVATALLYSATEAGFRLLDPIWIFLLLAIVGAAGIAHGAIVRTTQTASVSNSLPAERRERYGDRRVAWLEARKPVR
ncbi:MAG TPA: O-antigen ligase family protein [Candidatus Baltobacteraceae bacterium]|nr:O-antigen ligase family protein [Candidatus Baltobacteraceae bacterium]